MERCYNRLVIISTKFTHADLLSLPEDNKLREIIDGDLYVTPSPYTRHQRIVLELATTLRKYLKATPIGEVLCAPLDVILSEHDVLQPDLLFVGRERKEMLKDWVRGAPDLVVEVLSSTTASRDRGIKLKAYARFGVSEYWMVDPEKRTVEICRLSKEGYTLAQTCDAKAKLTSPLLPGFTLLVGSIFEE